MTPDNPNDCEKQAIRKSVSRYKSISKKYETGGVKTNKPRSKRKEERYKQYFYSSESEKAKEQ